MPENIEKFLSRVAEAAEKSALVKMTLSKPADKRDDLRNVYVKPVLIKEKRLFAFTYHYERRDEVKNYDAAQMLETLREMLPSRFQNAVLFTVSEDVTLLVSSKGKATIQNKRVQENREQNLDHDKQKNRLINPCQSRGGTNLASPPARARSRRTCSTSSSRSTNMPKLWRASSNR